MLFQSHCFWYPKDLEFAHRYEDSFCVDPERGRAAVSDGVSDAMFSRPWAILMADAAVENPPDITDLAAFCSWLSNLRPQWHAAIDFSKLDYFQLRKLNDVGGAFATLLWIELSPIINGEQENDDNEHVNYLLRGWAAGDCCLFIVREGELLCKFPLSSVDEFDLNPISICSVDLHHDNEVEFRSLEHTCQSGDLVILASDAFAKWVYYQFEKENPIDWEELWNMQSENWSSCVAKLRGLSGDDRMRVDDTTLIMLRLAQRSILEYGIDETVPAQQNAVISPVELTSASNLSTADGAAVDEQQQHDRPNDCTIADEQFQASDSSNGSEPSHVRNSHLDDLEAGE